MPNRRAEWTGMTPRSSEPRREPSPSRDVAQRPCRSICRWASTGETWLTAEAGPLPVFECAGCGSEWVRTEPWTPIDQSRQVPAAVAAERARHHA